MIQLYNGDCLELMKNIPDKSVDMILCDLPYGTTACKWDIIIPFDKLWEQYKRVIKIDGTIVLFGSQPFTSKLVCSNIEWFSHSWVWNKGSCGNPFLCKVQPLKIHEDVIVFSKPNNYDLDSFKELKEIFKEIFSKIGKTKKQIIDELGQGLDHCFRFNSLQWGLPTQNNYELLKEKYNLCDVPNYEELKRKYEQEFKKRKDVYNPQMEVKGKPIRKGYKGKNKEDGILGGAEQNTLAYNNIYYPKSIIEFKSRGEKKEHPTQKPIALLEYLIKSYTNENDVVLDNCMGSGSCGVASVNTNRNFIGIELDKGYFDIAEKRINEAQNI